MAFKGCEMYAGCAHNSRDRGGKLRQDRSCRDRRDDDDNRWGRQDECNHRDDDVRKFRNVRFDEDKNSDQGRETESKKK